MSIIAKTKPTIEGRILACLVSDGTDEAAVSAVRAAVEAEGAQLKIVAPHVGGVKTKQGKMMAGGHAGSPAAPSCSVRRGGDRRLGRRGRLLKGESAALDFIGDAFAHLKVIGYVDTALAADGGGRGRRRASSMTASWRWAGRAAPRASSPRPRSTASGIASLRSASCRDLTRGPSASSRGAVFRWLGPDSESGRQGPRATFLTLLILS